MDTKIDDTIVAISTPIGESAIGIVRMSGGSSLKIADRIFKGKDGILPSKFKSHTIRYGWIRNKAKPIDEVLLTLMRAPKTYTREDIVEISSHGGAVSLRKILELVINCGARLAEPGEFTKRAFLNGRIDLAKAEAVLDIIRAKTDTALKLGVEQLSGGLSNKIKSIRKELIDILAHIEADIDFCEEDIETNSRKILVNKINNVSKQLEVIILDSQKSNFFREGIKVTICGRPNVGKSSLLNAILRKERAIVTPIAGTTRDIIEEFINLGGVGIRLVDTAGVVKPKDLIEHHAVRLAKNSIALSDIVLLVFDSSQKLTQRDFHLIKELKGKDVIAVLNKIDLPQRIQIGKIRKEFKKIVSVSSLKQKNIDKLEKAIAGFVYKGKVISSEGLITTNARQIGEIKQARDLLDKAKNSFIKELSLEFVALDLKLALDCLGRITGEAVDSAILDKIFSEFCIGK
ncbi:MAG: tRNA uridine-5-carboxymethylaminomethyl(34) synthesis GTPase MnmE [Candidatus Omnitrophica bacterium]|nr:tRNA uridine-5-carboxymethylaminomethyl(34) synthesis GTPase MnmE [Candidatus Omnitrophota bacterium]MDD5351686.1 tRNA uridine-5-carboxymethylaminomethyl(34) synthesis GTPase MnmE [Candidatus Omnitrophota bacterium]MDD5550896.1 tRNA uridine-5-carboxymethylaminomethyl(34) synthesis GTPase MnmE [Candidatus Omnitrophota bacterium]